MKLAGLQKTTLVDYPGKVACTVFAPGCNWRCPFCQNPDLVEPKPSLPLLPEEKFFEFLESRRKWLDAVCVTGGEPCLQQDLKEFLKGVKDAGFLVKLDSNGSLPGVLRDVNEFVDYYALDVKAPLEKYDEAAGVKVDKKAVQESIDFVRGSGKEYEFRTTAVPRLYSLEDALAIGEWLKGSKRYFVQGFRPDVTLDPSFGKRKPFSEKELKGFADAVKPFFEETGYRPA